MAVITSPDNPAVKAARKLVRRQGRERAGAFLVEGAQSVREAVGRLRTLFVDADVLGRERGLVDAAAVAGAEIVVVSSRVLARLADTVTPQGLVGVATLPTPELTDVLDGAALTVVLWQVAEPGNAGTVIRTADAAGADGVILTTGSVDVRNPKAVRAAAGSLFHLPVVADVEGQEVLEACGAGGLQLVALDTGGSTPYTEVDLTPPSVLVLGNEAHGLPPAVLDACDVVAHLPLHAAARPGYDGTAESLNLAAAAAVVLYEAARQRRQARPAVAGLTSGGTP